MYKNLSETAAHKKSLWSKLIVPKKTFFPCRLLCLIVGNSFFRVQYFLFHESSCGHPFFKGYGILQKGICTNELRIYNVFEKYFYLSCVIVSKEHLQSCIWVAPSLFQEATCSDLVFWRALCFFETSSGSHLFFQRHWVNSQFQLQSSIQ